MGNDFRLPDMDIKMTKCEGDEHSGPLYHFVLLYKINGMYWRSNFPGMDSSGLRQIHVKKKNLYNKVKEKEKEQEVMEWCFMNHSR